MARKKAPEVRTTAGRVRGAWKAKGSVAVFRGVPFAAPPVGELRWRPPQPVDPWPGVRSATKDGPMAMQRATGIEEFLEALMYGQGWHPARARALTAALLRAPSPKASEDCLYLSVRTPQLDPAAKLPVMVWIHGGDHQDGAGSDPFYASNALASHGVVTVSINYRLGLMGYFAHPELSGESEHGVGGNYGTLDQIAALRWVQDNIVEFGGDPDNVTIFGESAGGESVLHLMTSPLARGLFHRAIPQSAGSGGRLLRLREPVLAFESAEDTSRRFAHALGVDGPDQLERLRAISAEDLYALVRAAPRLADHYPVIDGHVLPESPLVAFAGGRQAGVPLMIGSNSDEGTLLVPLLGQPLPEYRYRPSDPETIQDDLADSFGDDLDRLLELYPGLEKRDPAVEIELAGDHMFGSAAYWCAEHHAAAGHPTWLYHFSRVPPSPKQTAGAYHAAEIAFVHGTNLPVLPLTADDKALAAEMQRYWTDFARTGDPNGTGTAVGWPAFGADAPEWLRLDHSIVAEPVARLDQYELLNRRMARVVGATPDP